MSLKGDSMKKSHLYSAILIALFVLTSNIERFPKVTAPPPPPTPDRFIADIFPKNNNTNIHLLNTSALITINATDIITEIGITFNGTYALFNPEKTTNLTMILPFSLNLDVVNASFGVFVNDTQVPFEVVSTTKENLTSMGINIDFKLNFWFYYPITLITFNLTLLENTTYIVKYQFEGSIHKPLSFRDLFYMVYSSEMARLWKGSATERVEYKVLGRIPVSGSGYMLFSENDSIEFLIDAIDFTGGIRYIGEWNNTQNSIIQFGIRYDDSPYELYPEGFEMVFFRLFVLLGIVSVILLLWIKIRKRNRS